MGRQYNKVEKRKRRAAYLKRKTAASDKEKELVSGKTSLDQFQRQADAQLSDQSQRMRSNLLTEIQKAVADKAKAGGYTLVVNSDANEAFLYVSPDTDITDAVLAELNAGAPVDLNKSSGSPGFNISTNLP